MSKAGSDWQQFAEQDLFRDVTFTDEMVRRVFGEIGRRKKPAFVTAGRLVKPGFVILACLVLAALFVTPGPFKDTVDRLVPATAPPVEWPLSYQVLNAPIWQPGETILASDPDILPGLSNKFDPLYKRMVTDQLALSDVELLDTRPVDGFGTMLHYRLLADEEEESPTFFGFVLGEEAGLSTFYHVGYGHMFELANHEMTRIFGQPALKVEQSVCRTDGESCAWYFTIEQEDDPMLYVMFEAGSMERDVDSDGVEEIVVVTEKLNQIYVFKEIGGALHWASIREVLGADAGDSVAYHHDEGLFSIVPAGTEETAYYRVADEGTVLRQVR